MVETITTRDGLIIAVGTSKEVSAFEDPATNFVDLDRKVVVPGFIDTHSCLVGVGTQSLAANLLPTPDGPVNTIEDLQNNLPDFLNTSHVTRDYKVAIGFNYDDSQLTEIRRPNRHDLDAVTTKCQLWQCINPGI